MIIKLINLKIDQNVTLPAINTGALVLTFVMSILAGCAHTDPYENFERSKLTPADPRRLINVPSSPDGNIEQPLQKKLKEADDLQLALRYSVKQLGDERNLYDGAFWITAPYLVYNPAPRNLVRAAAAFGGGYAFLNSRPNEMPKMYDYAAKQISCVIIEYQRYLYPTNEIVDMKTQLRQFHSAYAQFQRDSDMLLRSINRNTAVRTGPTCALDGSIECREREKALGITYSGGSGPSALQKYFDNLSRASLRKLNMFEDLIYNVEEGLALDVAALVHKIMKDLGSDLSEKQSPLTLHVFGAQAPSNAALSGQSRRITEAAPTRPPLTRSANGPLNQRALDAEFQLKIATLNYEHYEADFQRRKSAGKKLMSSMSCDEQQISPATGLLSPAVIPNSIETPLPGAPHE